MFSKLRSKLIKALSFIEYINNKDNINMETELRYQKGAYDLGDGITSHSPEYRDLSCVHIFDSLQTFANFKKDCTGDFPDDKQMKRHRIMSVSTVKGTDGKYRLIVCSVRCSCVYCMSRSPIRYMSNELECYKDTDKLGFENKEELNITY